MSYGEFTMGTDPEFFVVDGAGFKSAIPLIKGTKESPTILANGAGLQTDNVALEFASPVANSMVGFLASIRGSLGLIHKELPRGYGISSKSAASFSPKELTHRGSRKFGCDPDYNAWTDRVNPIPQLPHPLFRSCGGHVHVGYVDRSNHSFLKTDNGRKSFIRTLDATLGIISVIVDNTKESIMRRVIYGKAGAYRPTEYGIEYRVLSNFWLKNPKLAIMVYRIVDDTLRLMRSDQAKYLISNIGSATIQDVINGGNVEDAKEIYKSTIAHYIHSDTEVAIDKALKVRGVNINRAWGIK